MVRDGPVSVQFSEVQSRAFVVPLRAPYCSARMGVEPQIQRRRTPRPRQKRQGSDHQIKIRSWRKARPKALRGSQRLLKHVKTLEEMLNSSQFVAPLLWGTQPPGAARKCFVLWTSPKKGQHHATPLRRRADDPPIPPRCGM